MAVNWDAIQGLVDQGFVANPNGTITTPGGEVWETIGPGQFRSVNDQDPPAGAAAPAAQQAGPNWGAIQALVDKGWKANPDGSLTNPEGVVGRMEGGQFVAATPKPPVSVEDTSARNAASIKNMLALYGLDELVPEVDGWVRQGLTWPEIEVQLRDPSTKGGKIVDRLYPEIQLRNKAGKQPMSIEQIQSFRTNALKMMRASGVPQGFMDSQDDFKNFIVGDVSLEELRDRIGEYETFGAQIAAGAGGELDLFERAYGVKPTAVELAALVLDPDKALPGLKRQFSAVKMDVAAGRAGFGDLSGLEAERLADIGVTDQQAVQGFGQLQDSRQLFDALPGFEGVDDSISRQEQFGAAFEGNARARKRIADRAAKRVAAFSGGGSFAATNSGNEGLGTAR